MIRAAVTVDGRPVLLLGLTDVNVQRLTTWADGSITVPLVELLPPGVDPARAELLIFHATRETCVRLARALGVPEAAFLNMLGEG